MALPVSSVTVVKPERSRGPFRNVEDDLTTSLPFMNARFHVRIEAGLVIGKVIQFAVKPCVQP